MNLIQHLPGSAKFLFGPNHDEIDCLVKTLSSALPSFSPNQDTVAQAILSTVIVHSQVKGIFYTSSPSRSPVMMSIIEAFGHEALSVGLIKEHAYSELIAGVKKTIEQFQIPPFIDKPGWQDAPIIRWIIEMLGTQIFESCICIAHRNLIDIVISGIEAEGENFNLVKNVRDITYPIRRYARMVTGTELHNDLSQLLISKVAMDPPMERNRTGNTTQTYIRDIRRLINNDASTQWVEQHRIRAAESPQSKSNGREYDLIDESNEVRDAFLRSAELYESEIAQGMDVDEILGAQPEIPKLNDQTKKSFFDPWVQTIYRNPTRHTPGVLSVIEIALLLQQMSTPANADENERCNIARVVLLAGIFYGWTRQLTTARVENTCPEPYAHPGIVFLSNRPELVSIKPEIPVGYPKSFIPSAENRAQFPAIIAQHDRDYEHVDHTYRLAIHPIVSREIAMLVRACHPSEGLLSIEQYNRALNDLSTAIQKCCPNSKHITAGRLSATFQGYATSAGLDGPARYAICGRPTKISEMSINYTRISISKTCKIHWQFINQIWDEIQIQFNLLGKMPKSSLSTGIDFRYIPPSVDQNLHSYTGSWSVPRVSIVREIIEICREQSERWDIPAYERTNWQIRLVAIESMTIMCYRDFEINDMEIPVGHQYRGHQIVYRAKTKYWEGNLTHGTKYIPQIIYERWWNCIDTCASNYTTGPIWCLFGHDGQRQRFNMQIELDHISHQYVRAKGLRHLGRTLLRDFGMPDVFLNYIMNHEGDGYEKYNPIRGNRYIEFEEIYNNAAHEVEKCLQMDR